MLTTHSLVVQPVQICFEFFLLPCWIYWAYSTLMSHLKRCYVSCFSVLSSSCSPRITQYFFRDNSLYECVSGTCEHVSLSGTTSDRAVTFSFAVICSISTVICPFSTLNLPSRLFFGFPFPPCSVYLYCSSLLVGLVFPTFSLYGTRQRGRLERKERQCCGLGGRKRRWMQSRQRDGGREGAKTVPEQGDGELD